MAFENWDIIVGKYEGDPYRRFVMIPTILSLLPDIKNKKILDVGCGNGILIPHLLKAAPQLVVGIDFTPHLLDIARKRLPNSVILYQCDITESIDLTEAPFDGAIANFVLNEVSDIKKVFCNIYSKLSIGAFLVVGVTHPTYLFGKHLIDPNNTLKGYKSYFSSQKIIDVYTDGDNSIEFTAYTFPLSSYINSAIDVGFKIDKMVEPETLQEVIDANPSYYEKYRELPVSMYLLMSKE